MTKLETEYSVKIFKALSDQSRLRVLLALSKREMWVCQIVHLLELAPPTVSRHLQILKDSGLIESSKKGRWVRYRLGSKELSAKVHNLLEPVFKAVARSDQAKSDEKKLKGLLTEDPEMLCQKMNKCK